MTSSRKSEIIAGILFLVATISYIIGSGLITNNTANLLALNGIEIKIGVFLELINCCAVVGISILLYPALKKYGEGLAVGYIGFRVIESVLLIICAISPLLMLSLAKDAQGETQNMQIILVNLSDYSFQMAMIMLGVGSLILCYILYIGKLIPRILSILGFIGYIALIISGLVKIANPESDLDAILFSPGAIFEIVFPLWLIFKGLKKEE